MRELARVGVGIVAAAALAACSGGGKGGGNGDPEVGSFVDSAVAGLRYEGATFSGRTNSEGEYDYEPGEEVCFFVGDVELGCTEGRGVVTPIDLFEDAEPDDDQVINVVRLLLSLDEDGDPDNGIDVSDVETDESHAGIDFDQSESDFANNALVSNLVTNEGHDGTLPSAEDAEEHFEESLEDNDYWEQNFLGDFLMAIDGSLGESDFDIVEFDTPTFSEDDLEEMNLDADESSVTFDYPVGDETCAFSGSWSEQTTQQEGVTFITVDGDVDCPSYQGDTTRFSARSLPANATFSSTDLPSEAWVVKLTYHNGESLTTHSYFPSILGDAEDIAARNATLSSSGEVEFEHENGEYQFNCSYTGQMTADKTEMFGEATCTGIPGDPHFWAEQLLF